MVKAECYHVVMHFRDYKEARAILDAASLENDTAISKRPADSGSAGLRNTLYRCGQM